MRLEEILKIQDVETKASQIALSVIPDYDNVNNFFSRQAARHILQSLLKHCLEQTQGEMTRASLQEFLKEFHSLLYDEKELSRRILATKEVLTIEYMLSPRASVEILPLAHAHVVYFLTKQLTKSGRIPRRKTRA